MYILGISAFYHDSAAVLLRDDHILAAAQEERFSRKKNDASFPQQAILFCLQKAEIYLHEVDYVVFYEKPFLKFERLLETYLAFVPNGIRSYWQSMPLWIKDKLFQKKILIKRLIEIDPLWTGKKLLFTQHHQAHAASAFFPSAFKESLILTVDGVGEWTTTSLAYGKDNTITPLKELRFPHSLGLLYSSFTYYLGFKVNSDEYKVMGLAPYGKPAYVDIIYRHLIDVKPDGSFRLNMDYFTYGTSLRMTGRKFNALFGKQQRFQSEKISEFHMDLACSIQKVTEDIVLLMLKQLSLAYDTTNLCLAGGVALNCVINGKIAKNTRFKNVWIQPAAGDAGGALGAAYAVYYSLSGNERIPDTIDKMQSGLLGPSFTRNEIRKLLIDQGLVFQEMEDPEFYSTLALDIANGKVIGFFKGKMEFGPRALGARSIIGDARNPEMQSVMNLKIKFRESFRPFAPAVLEEFCSDYFDLSTTSPYMLLVAEVLSKHRLNSFSDEQVKGLDRLKQIRSVIPSATHVDYSARVQTVSARENPDFYALIHAFYKLTGCPVIINTSFNVKDEPIVCTPEDALKCFRKSEMDVLAMENFVIYKSKQQN